MKTYDVPMISANPKTYKLNFNCGTQIKKFNCYCVIRNNCDVSMNKEEQYLGKKIDDK